MVGREELACVYSSLILQDDNSPVTTERIQTLLQAANADVEPYWPGIFSNALTLISLKDLISNISAGAGSGGLPQLATDSTQAETGAGNDPKKEDKKEEGEEEEDDDMGFGLFD